MNPILFFFRYDHFEIWSIDANKRLVPINYQDSNIVPLYFLISGTDVSIGGFPKEQYLNGVGGTYGLFWKDIEQSGENIIRGISKIAKKDLLGTAFKESILPEICRNYFSSSSIQELLKNKTILFCAEPFCDLNRLSNLVSKLSEVISFPNHFRTISYWKMLNMLYPSGVSGNQGNGLFAIGSYNSDLFIFNINRNSGNLIDQQVLLGKGIDPRLNAISDFCIEKIINRGSTVSPDELRKLIQPDTHAILNLLSNGFIVHPFTNPRLAIAPFELTIHKSVLLSKMENPIDLLFIKNEVISFYSRNHLKGSKLFILTSPLNIPSFYSQFEEIGIIEEDSRSVDDQLKFIIINFEKLIENDNSKAGLNADNSSRIKCPKCNKEFPNNSLLESHNQNCGVPPAFKCPKCSKEFPNKILLDGHTKICGAPPAFKCPKCSKEFPNKILLDGHTKICGVPPAFKCPKCSKDFPNKILLDGHLKTCGTLPPGPPKPPPPAAPILPKPGVPKPPVSPPPGPPKPPPPAAPSLPKPGVPKPPVPPPPGPPKPPPPAVPNLPKPGVPKPPVPPTKKG